MRALLVIGIVAAAAGTAHAYPQFQISRDQTCSGCHISPAGGGLLSENGANTAEAISQFGTNPELMYGAIDLPDWLAVGGDIRGMWGYLQAPQRYLYGFPMQGDLYFNATKGSISVQVTAGLRPAQVGNEALTTVGFREHYVQWQQEPGASEGVFVRAGHLMPVFGLRWVEHPLYVRRYGGTPLMSETYGLSASLIKGRFEAHASGFVENPILDGVRLSNGGALYGEVRPDDKTSIGIGAMGEFSDFDQKYRGTFTVKRVLVDNLMVMGEAQLINPHVSDYGYKQIASQLMITYLGPSGLMLDAGWGHYDENLRIKDLDRDSIDVNVHWFATSHIELLLVNRVEFIGLGKGGPTGAHAFAQLHYRL